jgi:RNA polymerase sigma-70 factor (ECF subfamily)
VHRFVAHLTSAREADDLAQETYRALVTALDPDRRAAFVLTQLLDLSYAEAADVCECPVGTIRSRVARAREDLVAALADSRGARPRRADHG